MAATDMKFGPEWLRALSDGGLGPSGAPNSTNITQSSSQATPAAPKYKLAEFRYGREEMLALYDSNTKPPDQIKEFPHLFVEKGQLPLAMVPMTDDEQRLWSRSVNSEIVHRMMGKGQAPERERIPDRGVPALRGGRGGSLADRGRGRGRGFYQRGFDDEGDSPPERRPEFRRTFERSTSVEDSPTTRPVDKRFERTFVRPGAEETGPRTLLNKTNASRSSSAENWRTAARGEDREGWRTASARAEEGAGAGGGSSGNTPWGRDKSWRFEDHNDVDHSQRNGQRKSFANYNKNFWDEEEDDRRNSLPEWSLDEGPEGGVSAKFGTFDSTGAFMEEEDEEEEGQYKDAEQGNDGMKDADDGGDDWTNIGKNGKKIKDVGMKGKDNLTNKSEKDSKNEKLDEMKNLNQDRTDKTSENRPQTSLPNNQTQSTSMSSRHRTHSPKPSLNQMINNQMKQEASNSSATQRVKSLLDSSDRDRDDGLTNIEKEAEHMVAQWTADDSEDRKDEPNETQSLSVSLNVNHENAFKWFYRDPQGEIQGPFTPHEMYDWFSAGYFAMDLLVRRGCDEVFTQLGALFKMWERVPFAPVHGAQPQPIRESPSSHSPPSNKSSSRSSPPSQPLQQHQHPNHQQNQHIMQQQQQRQQQLQQQQQQLQQMNHHDMQSQLRLLLAQLKKQEGFSELSQQQQQQVLVQRYVQVQQIERQRQAAMQQQASNIPNSTSRLSKDEPPIDVSMANMRIQSGNRQTPGNSIWDVNSGHAMVSVSAIEEMQRKEQERKEQEEKRKLFEEEQLRLEQEEFQRKIVEEQKRKYEEMKRIEEERIRNQEMMRKQEEERRKREEEEERLRIEQERRRMEEERRMIEEQRRRQEELIRLEEYARRQQEEERRRREAEILAEKERQQHRQQMQMHELAEQQQQQQQRQQQLRQLQQQQMQQEALKKQLQEKQRQGGGQAWGGQEAQHNTLSLMEIQRLQEKKEADERERQIQFQQDQMQALFQAQQQQQQKQQNLTWANSYPTPNDSSKVKTLADIQKEESEKLAKQKNIEKQKQQSMNNSVPAAGIWNNNVSSQLFKPGTGSNKASSPSNAASSPMGFWEAEPTSSAAHQQTQKRVQSNRANESALQNSNNNKGSNVSSNNQTVKSSSRSKKEEEAVLKLFENQRRQKTDEFTQWCNEALTKFQSSIDIPVFIAFLKDVESPFEVNDYVRSYLGDTKETRDFGKKFIERRSFFRNQAKKEASEGTEVMWGPAPAITPSVNKPSLLSQSPSNQLQSGDSDSGGFIQAGKKKKKGKRIVDNSILGFTVQADPTRINVGEIEQMED